MDTFVEPLVRVEGGGEIVIYVDERGFVKDLEYRLTEAPRFFERIVKGLNYSIVPDVVSRVCGLCGVSYVVTSVKAFEECLGISVPEDVEKYRDIVCLVERIKSHTIHLLLLNLPDLIGVRDVLELEKNNPNLFKRIVLVVRFINELVKTFIGRFHNVVNIKVGGVHKTPDKWVFEKTLRLVKENLLPEYTAVAEAILGLETTTCLKHELKYCTVLDDKYPIKGVILEYDGCSYSADVFYEKIVKPIKRGGWYEFYVVNDEAYLVGPIARFNKYRGFLLNETKSLLEKYGWFKQLNNIYQSFAARIAETIDALHRLTLVADGLRDVTSFKQNDEPRKVGRGLDCYYATEAPRGVLYQRFTIDSEGRVIDAKIITPTAQNIPVAEKVARERTVGLTINDAVHEARRTIVSIDPCISCSTHSMRVKVVNK